MKKVNGIAETVENRLRTEIKEEYGTDVLEFEYLGFSDLHWINIGFLWIIKFFNKEEVYKAESYKLDEVKWFKWE